MFINSSSFDGEKVPGNIIRNEMFSPLNVNSDENIGFRSQNEFYPWIQIDLGYPREIEWISITQKVCTNEGNR